VDKGRTAGSDGTERLVRERWIVCRHVCAWQPPTDVYEDERGIIIRVEVAGMRSEDFVVELTGTEAECQLVIAGTRNDLVPKRLYHQMEIHFGEFRTQIGLPWVVKAQDVEASYEAGFLVIRLPRQESQRRPATVVEADMRPGED